MVVRIEDVTDHAKESETLTHIYNDAAERPIAGIIIQRNRDDEIAYVTNQFDNHITRNDNTYKSVKTFKPPIKLVEFIETNKNQIDPKLLDDLETRVELKEEASEVKKNTNQKEPQKKKPKQEPPPPAAAGTTIYIDGQECMVKGSQPIYDASR